MYFLWEKNLDWINFGYFCYCNRDQSIHSYHKKLDPWTSTFLSKQGKSWKEFKVTKTVRNVTNFPTFKWDLKIRTPQKTQPISASLNGVWNNAFPIAVPTSQLQSSSIFINSITAITNPPPPGSLPNPNFHVLSGIGALCKKLYAYIRFKMRKILKTSKSNSTVSTFQQRWFSHTFQGFPDPVFQNSKATFFPSTGKKKERQKKK